MSARWRSGCWSTTAQIWWPSARAIRTGCAGTWSSSTQTLRHRCPRALDRERWLGRIARRLAALPQSARVRVARDELRRIRELTRAERALERELTAAIRALHPELLAEGGIGAIIAATLIGRTAITFVDP
jgi:hypothetical protein